MKKLLSLTAITFFALGAISFAASEKETIIETEKSIWQIIKDKKFDAFEKHLAVDFRGVYGSGINKRDREVADVKKIDFKSFSLSDIDVVMIDKSVALVTYTVAVQGTQDGREIPAKMHAASIWKKEGNDWRVAFHSDCKAE